MDLTCRTFVLVAILSLPASAAAQAPHPSPKPPARTTWDSVYTAAQATRGRDVYAGMCRACHTPASHTGEMFASWWDGKTVADLFTYVRQQMPKSDPGSLSAEEYADVIAFLLTMNAMPPGRAELPPDSAALAGIRITMKQPTKQAAKQPTNLPVRKQSPQRTPPPTRP